MNEQPIICILCNINECKKNTGLVCKECKQK